MWGSRNEKIEVTPRLGLHLPALGRDGSCDLEYGERPFRLPLYHLQKERFRCRPGYQAGASAGDAMVTRSQPDSKATLTPASEVSSRGRSVDLVYRNP